MKLATVLVIGFEVPSQNRTDRRHWSACWKDRKRINWLLVAALPQAGCPHGGRRRRVEIIAYRRRLIADKANLIGGAKTLVDAIVGAGVLVDDSDRWAEITYDQALISKGGHDRPTTVIRIYDLDEKA
jgi:hypothetical protein